MYSMKMMKTHIQKNLMPTVIHTTWWSGRALYYDPYPHLFRPDSNNTKIAQKLKGIEEGKIVIMQRDDSSDGSLRASGEYEGEFKVVEAIIQENGSHALILENTGREIVRAPKG